MIFKHICKKGNKYLAKIETDGKDKWFTVTQAVYNFATKNFEEGSEVDVQYTVKNGQYFATKIMTAGSGKTIVKAEETSEEPTDYACEDCGKELKDGKYKKCYTCNKKNPVKSKNMDTTNAISRQNANHATSRALIALQGQIDPNNIFEIAERLHEMFLRLAKGE